MKQDLMQLYKLYLFALKEREQYGDKYGDNDEIMEMYEKELKNKPINKLLLKALKGNKYENNY